jgi:hypothetical protein
MKVYIPPESRIATATLELFISDHENSAEEIDVTHHSCIKAGSLSLAFNSDVGNTYIPVSVSIEYGRVEIWVTLTNTITHVAVRTNIGRDGTVLI